MTDEETRQIIQQLATLAESVSGLRRDGEKRDAAFEQEREDSHESRRNLHDKVNNAVAELAELKSDVRVSAQVAEQTRAKVDELKETVDRNAKAVAPTVAQFEQVQSLGRTILWLIGGGGLAALTTIIFWGEQIRAWAAQWLGIK